MNRLMCQLLLLPLGSSLVPLPLVQVMLDAVAARHAAAAPAGAARTAAQRQRSANCTAVALSTLAGLRSLTRRRVAEPSDPLAEQLLLLSSCMLEEQVRLRLWQSVQLSSHHLCAACWAVHGDRGAAHVT